MASLTIGLSGSAVVNGSKSYTLDDTQVTRLINALKYYYGGNLTNAQLLVNWADDLIEVTKRRVVTAEQNTNPPSPMVVT